MLILTTCSTAPLAAQKSARASKASSAKIDDATRAARALARIAARREHCEGEGPEYPTTNELQDCSGAAQDAANTLLRRSQQNARFDKLLFDVSDAFLFALTPHDEYGHDALAQRVVVTGTYADLALKRAAILTGAERAAAPHGKGKTTPPPFAWLKTTPGLRKWTEGDPDPRDVSRRWAAIRDADCATYPVPRCAERLDEAVSTIVKPE